MMATLGIAVIGQAPRDDIAAIFAAALPPDTRIVVRGCLDGLRDAEVDALPPRDGDDTLYTRLRGTRDVKISKAAVIERAPVTLDALRRDGADALLFACTGAFPPMRGDARVVFPSRILVKEGNPGTGALRQNGSTVGLRWEPRDAAILRDS